MKALGANPPDPSIPGLDDVFGKASFSTGMLAENTK